MVGFALFCTQQKCIENSFTVLYRVLKSGRKFSPKQADTSKNAKHKFAMKTRKRDQCHTIGFPNSANAMRMQKKKKKEYLHYNPCLEQASFSWIFVSIKEGKDNQMLFSIKPFRHLEILHIGTKNKLKPLLVIDHNRLVQYKRGQRHCDVFWLQIALLPSPRTHDKQI